MSTSHPSSRLAVCVRPEIHQVEPRIFLASSAVLVDGKLTVRGTPGDDEIAVTPSADERTVRVDVNTDGYAFPANQVARIACFGGDGADRITNRTPIRSTLAGGAGDDTITGGPSADVVRPGTGELNSVLLGGGRDVVDLSEFDGLLIRSESSNADFSYGVSRALCFTESRATLLATAGDDVISISTGDARGLWTYDGGGGNDDVFISRYDNDTLVDQPATIAGGDGDDTLTADFGTTTSLRMLGGDGDDRAIIDDPFVRQDPLAIDLGPGRDTLDLSEFEDDPEEEPFSVYMGAGTETLIPARTDQNYQIFGNSRPNTIYVFGQATVSGLGGDDLIIAQSNAGHSLNGGSGNDTLIAGGGDTEYFVIGDTLDGGDGNDVADYSQSVTFDYDTNVSRLNEITLSAIGANQRLSFDGIANDGIAGESDQILSSIENLLGGDGDDTLRGGGGDDTLSGGGGRDRLFGDAGNDLLLGRGGSKDRLDGGSGFDTATADTLGGVIDLSIDVEAVS